MLHIVELDSKPGLVVEVDRVEHMAEPHRRPHSRQMPEVGSSLETGTGERIQDCMVAD